MISRRLLLLSFAAISFHAFCRDFPSDRRHRRHQKYRQTIHEYEQTGISTTSCRLRRHSRHCRRRHAMLRSCFVFCFRCSPIFFFDAATFDAGLMLSRFRRHIAYNASEGIAKALYFFDCLPLSINVAHNVYASRFLPLPMRHCRYVERLYAFGDIR